MRTTNTPDIRERAVRAAAAVLATWYRRVPFRPYRAWAWKAFVSRHVVWRRLDVEIVTAFGARMPGRLDDLISRHLYFFGVFEPAVTALYREILQPGDVMVDVGANVGAHTLLAAHLVGPQGRVHAIEASPSIFARLRINLDANGAGQVLAHNIAVAEREGIVPIFLSDPSNLGASTIIPGEADRLGAAHEALVPARPLQEIVPPEDLAAARLIKIDVEGAEWLVVQGMRDALPLLRPDVSILLEVNPKSIMHLGGTLAKLVDIFTQAGFAASMIPNRYDEDFYFNTPDLTPRPATAVDLAGDFDVADLLFRRPPA